jgi:uncharacterized protein (DUF2384 family)
MSPQPTDFDNLIARQHPELWAHAVETFGSPQKAARWIRLPLAGLDGQSPLDAASISGAERIEAILGRIDYGIYS